MSWFRSLLTRSRRFTIRDDPELAAQFWVVFRATLARVGASGEIPAGSGDALKRITELLAPDREPSWDDAYEVDQLFVLLYRDDALGPELEARLEEAAPILGEAQTQYYRRKLDAPMTRGELRELLGVLIRSIQWSYRLDEARRWWARRATNLFIIVTALFGAMLAYVIVGFRVGSTGTDYSPAGPEILSVAAAAGGWGAAMSMISSLRTRLEGLQLRDLRMISAQTILVSRALIGVGAGLVLYLFLVGGILAGNIFPDLSGPSLTLRDFALLVIWTVVGGFSEHLVPDLLDRTAARAQENESKASASPAPRDSSRAEREGAAWARYPSTTGAQQPASPLDLFTSASTRPHQAGPDAPYGSGQNDPRRSAT